ncbi:ead/Ea22-like family protein [Cronobacter sakazakii]|uniref:ead/Ea22-like family protein n=1 Tax=Cronobacter sakazakii TaxID=28141 RepID=UPI002DB66A70|nr:ead/Ea22-like family protein [Cronobacter sakazakii]MEB8574912.1 ead/Ea22-like family protein [Cronobacter sakazakii]
MNTAKLKAVPRHSVDGYGRQDISYNDPEGEFVFYSDYEVLIAALEAAEKRGADMEVACELFAESKLAQIKLEAALGIAQQRLAELEARNLEVIIPPRRCHDYASVAVQQRDEQWYKALHDACDRAGINLETGGEA